MGEAVAILALLPIIVSWTLAITVCVILLVIGLYFASYLWPPTARDLLRRKLAPFDDVARLVRALRGMEVDTTRHAVVVQGEQLQDLKLRVADLEQAHGKLAEALEDIRGGPTPAGGFNGSSH